MSRTLSANPRREAGHEKELRATADDNITSPGAAEHLLLLLFLLLYLYVPQNDFHTDPLDEVSREWTVTQKGQVISTTFLSLNPPHMQPFYMAKSLQRPKATWVLGFKREFE